MTDIARAYKVGDYVISNQSIVAYPIEGTGKTLEIGKGYIGVVVDVCDYEHRKPYVVDFEVSDGVTVEANVREDQVARIRPRISTPVPPTRPREPVYRPTTQYPNRRCKPLHSVSFLLWCYVYSIALSSFFELTLAVTAVAVAAAYYNHFSNTGIWSWWPDAFRYKMPGEDEMLVVSPENIRLAPRADLVLIGALSLLSAYHVDRMLQDKPLNPWVFDPLVGLTCCALANKMLVHDRAVRVEPRQ